MLRSPAWGSRSPGPGGQKAAGGVYTKRSRAPGVPLSMAGPRGTYPSTRSPNVSPGLAPKSPKMHTANGEGSAEASKFEKELHNALEHLHCKHDTRRLTAIMASNQVHIVFHSRMNLTLHGRMRNSLWRRFQALSAGKETTLLRFSVLLS